MIQIVIVSTSQSVDSRSRELCRRVESEFAGAGVLTRFVDLTTFPQVWCDARPLEEYPSEYRDLHELISESEGTVIGGPVYFYSVAGVTKNLIDIVGHALAGRPFALVSASGSRRSHLAYDPLATAIVHEYGAHWFPDALQTSEDMPDDPDLPRRIQQFAVGFTEYCAFFADWRSTLRVSERRPPNPATHGDAALRRGAGSIVA